MSLPDEIYQLTNLTGLYLHHNKLESISEEIGKLTKLKFLALSMNDSLKSLPKSIGKLVNLIGLSLYGLHSLTKLPDSITKVKHALDPYNKRCLKKWLAEAEDRYNSRITRRMIILTARVPHAGNKVATRQATKNLNSWLIHQVLVQPKLAKLIASYVDWD